MQKVIDALKGYTLFADTAFDYAIAFGIGGAILIVLYISRHYFLVWLEHLAKKTDNDFDNKLISIFKGIHTWYYYVLSTFIALKFITLSEEMAEYLYTLILVSTFVQLEKSIDTIVKYRANKYQKKLEEDGSESKG